ncbi:hypothetical protein K438DRAFT_1770602 [Mycena galopus ATCC 62051]|nr:hypothetical protein K438DRAFT_1770602 [Mycena galopus ATCC 62051]
MPLWQLFLRDGVLWFFAVFVFGASNLDLASLDITTRASRQTPRRLAGDLWGFMSLFRTSSDLLYQNSLKFASVGMLASLSVDPFTDGYGSRRAALRTERKPSRRAVDPSQTETDRSPSSTVTGIRSANWMMTDKVAAGATFVIWTTRKDTSSGKAFWRYRQGLSV